jgi:DNA-binding NtrC family response regulator
MKDRLCIMIVDDESIVRESFKRWFEKSGHRVLTAASGAEALRRLEAEPIDLLFVDIKMPGMSGLELLDRVSADFPDASVVIITAYGSIDTAVNAMKKGASDYLLKPFKPDQLDLVLEKISQQRRLSRQFNYLKGHLEQITRFDNIIGRSEAMQEVFALIPEVAASSAPVLLTGETGTGKELIAKAIHATSDRAPCPFVPINCGALPESLLESELFGHVKGAFTGAERSSKGFLEIVDGGTLFLDEVGEISPRMQVDLLRVLQEHQVVRLGSRHPVDVDFRLISATSRQLDPRRVEQGVREDFFYRINVIHIDIPPLRRRKEDIPLLVDHFLKKLAHHTSKRVDRLTNAALMQLTAYDWPGNVREVENAVERAVVLAKSRTLDNGDFAFLQPSGIPSDGRTSLKEVERRYICQVLADCNQNVTRAAEVLGINRTTLHKKINRYGIQRSEGTKGDGGRNDRGRGSGR